jgi:hypothetical protein
VTAKVYRHPHEVWALAPCPSQAALLFTVHSQGGHRDASACAATAAERSD